MRYVFVYSDTSLPWIISVKQCSFFVNILETMKPTKTYIIRKIFFSNSSFWVIYNHIDTKTFHKCNLQRLIMYNKTIYTSRRETIYMTGCRVLHLKDI